MTNRKTILFVDLDSTIITNPFWTAVFPQTSAEFAKKTALSPQSIVDEFVSENQRRLENPPTNQALAMDWDDIIETVAKEKGITTNNSVIDLVRRHSSQPYTSILDDADTVLRKLSKNSHRILVAASMGLSKYQLPVLKALDLYDRFDDFLMPDITGYLKTDHLFYSKYVENYQSALFISVGDHYYDDVMCPKQFGFKAVLKATISKLSSVPVLERKHRLLEFKKLIRGFPDRPTILPDVVITDLSELCDVVKYIEEHM